MNTKPILALAALAACGAALPAAASAAQAAKHVVGTCLAGTQFSTIQSAVTATPNGTVYVCPGTYPEQISDVTSTSIVGVADGHGTQPRIVVPAGGLQFNFISYDGTTILDDQIVVLNGTNVTISGLTVDGANNGVQDCGRDPGNGTSYAEDPRGIDFEDTTGTITNNYVINQANARAYGGCQSGEGIWAEVSTRTPGNGMVTITSNHVQDFQKNGITVRQGLAANVTNNTVVGQGATPLIAGNGIEIADGATATVSGNAVSDEIYSGASYGASGILVYDAKANVVSNSVSNTQYAIAYVGVSSDTLVDNATINNNRIATTRAYDAIDLCGANNATINSNVISGSGEAAIHIDSGCGPTASAASISNNRIDLACGGILVGPGSTASPGANNIQNAASNVITNSDVCPLPTNLSRASRAEHVRFSPK